MAKVYLAAPLFPLLEREFNRLVAIEMSMAFALLSPPWSFTARRSQDAMLDTIIYADGDGAM